MQEFEDQLGRRIRVNYPPQRIISLVPSQTELISALGALPRLVGRTKFCIHPAEMSHTSVIGGTKNFHLDKIDALQPDLIVANKEENDQSQVLQLAGKYPVWVSDVKNLSTACQMIRGIGKVIGTDSEAASLARKIESGFPKTPAVTASALYIIWKDPWMAAGCDTFISSMMPYAGFSNVLTDIRYPQLDVLRLRELNPDYVLLSSEPYPFKEKHVEEMRKLLPNSTVKLVDGEMFSWYGSRLLNAMEYFRTFRK